MREREGRRSFSITQDAPRGGELALHHLDLQCRRAFKHDIIFA